MVLFDKGNKILKSVEFEKMPAEWTYQLSHADMVPDRADAAVALGTLTGDESASPRSPGPPCRIRSGASEWKQFARSAISARRTPRKKLSPRSSPRSPGSASPPSRNWGVSRHAGTGAASRRRFTTTIRRSASARRRSKRWRR